MTDYHTPVRFSLTLPSRENPLPWHCDIFIKLEIALEMSVTRDGRSGRGRRLVWRNKTAAGDRPPRLCEGGGKQ